MSTTRKKGYLFDFDGVISHSECQTNSAISDVLSARGCQWIPVSLDTYGGWTWQGIAGDVCRLTPGVSETHLATDLAAAFEKRVLADPVLVPGVDKALQLASQRAPTGIATGSDRPLVLDFLDHFKLTPYVHHIVSAEMDRAPKPDPMCFQMLADRLGVCPTASFVFEDSLAGLSAGLAIGARVIGVHYQRSLNHAMDSACHRAIPDFTELVSEGFFT
jgi:HAD superfamily hydrolase (TIGR01509 family)